MVRFVWYKALEEQAAGEVEGIASSCDISASGVGIITPRAIAHDTRVFLELGLPEGRHVSAVGRVVYCRALDDGRHRVGLTLEVVPPNDRQRLAALLRGRRAGP